VFPFVYDYGAATLGFSPPQCFEADDLANCLLPQDNHTKLCCLLQSISAFIWPVLPPASSTECNRDSLRCVR
jgi:hypothetical protein